MFGLRYNQVKPYIPYRGSVDVQITGSRNNMRLGGLIGMRDELGAGPKAAFFMRRR